MGDAEFAHAGRYFLSCRSEHSGGEEQRTQVSSGALRHIFDVTFEFPLTDEDGDLRLCLTLTRLAALSLPGLSPRGVMANNLASTRDDVGSTGVVAADDVEESSLAVATLTLADLLSMPQPFGSEKRHRVELMSSKGGGACMGSVMLEWRLEDRVAEAREAAERAAERHRQERKRAHREAKLRREAEAQEAEEAFDRSLEEAKWHDILNSYRVVLWLPEGASPSSILLSARQAVGLADAAKTRKSGLVAFAHSGLRITLTAPVASSLRTKLEAKMVLQAREILEDAREPILVRTSAPVTPRAVTAANVQASSSLASQPSATSDRHPTAPPRARVQAPHPESSSWLQAAVLPLRPTTPAIVAPHPKTTAIVRAQARAARESAEKTALSLTSAFASIAPTPPPRVAPQSRF